jgi:DNA polymerase-1
MGLFSQAKMDEINAIAEKSKEVLKPIKVSKSVTSSQHEIQESIKAVQEYFKDSPAILITSKAQLHEYVLKAIESGYCAIDTETTGLDRVHDTIVGASLYYPGGVECYIPCKHLAPVFEVPYENQVSYEDLGSELAYFVEAKTKMIFANADFDLAMIYKDLKVDLIPVCYYDVITAWRCIKEDELDNRLKALYMKYVKKGKGDPKSFSDFFSPKLFPYCPTDVAKLYAANDAKITYELFFWQLPYVTKTHPKCQKHKLEKIADLIWNIEIPMIRVCALMHRTGVYFDKNIRDILKIKYDKKYQEELNKLSEIIQEIMDNSDAITVSKSPFKNGAAFNEASPKQVTYLLNNFLHCDVSSGDKATLTELNLPVTNQILKVRALNKLLNAFVDKLPNEVGKDGRIHATFKSIGADTGRMSSSEPNVQQIPSHALDIRHQFRATPAKKILLDADYQESNDTVCISLNRWYSVTTSVGQKDVEDLVVGDTIKLLEEGKEVWRIVKEISNSSDDSTLRDVVC